MRRIRKQRIEAAEAFRLGGRIESAESEENEAKIIDSYLPIQADTEQTQIWVKEAIAAINAKTKKEIGKVIGIIMKNHKNDVDAALVKSIADSLLEA